MSTTGLPRSPALLAMSYAVRTAAVLIQEMKGVGEPVRVYAVRVGVNELLNRRSGSALTGGRREHRLRDTGEGTPARRIRLLSNIEVDIAAGSGDSESSTVTAALIFVVRPRGTGLLGHDVAGTRSTRPRWIMAPSLMRCSCDTFVLDAHLWARRRVEIAYAVAASRARLTSGSVRGLRTAASDILKIPRARRSSATLDEGDWETRSRSTSRSTLRAGSCRRRGAQRYAEPSGRAGRSSRRRRTDAGAT